MGTVEGEVRSIRYRIGQETIQKAKAHPYFKETVR
jgi:hypothetical protein